MTTSTKTDEAGSVGAARGSSEAHSNGTLTRDELLSEIAHVRNLLAESEARVRALTAHSEAWVEVGAAIDKLTAAKLHVERLGKRLGAP